MREGGEESRVSTAVRYTNDLILPVGRDERLDHQDYTV